MRLRLGSDKAMTKPAERAVVIARITNYLSAGGLFNPELMEHTKVRDLLIACRAVLTRPGRSPARGRKGR